MRDELLPTATLPKLSVEGDTDNDPVVGGGGVWAFDPAETPAHPARKSRQASTTRVPRRRDRELCVLSMHTIIRLEPGGVERAKSHDRWRKLNCTLVMMMAIIEVVVGILKAPDKSGNWLYMSLGNEGRKGLRQI